MKLDMQGIINTLVAALLVAAILGGAAFYRDVTAHMARVDTTLSIIGKNLELLNATLTTKGD